MGGVTSLDWQVLQVTVPHKKSSSFRASHFLCRPSALVNRKEEEPASCPPSLPTNLLPNFPQYPTPTIILSHLLSMSSPPYPHPVSHPMPSHPLTPSHNPSPPSLHHRPLSPAYQSPPLLHVLALLLPCPPPPSAHHPHHPSPPAYHSSLHIP